MKDSRGPAIVKKYINTKWSTIVKSMEYFYFDVLDHFQPFAVSIDPQNFITLAQDILEL